MERVRALAQLELALPPPRLRGQSSHTHFEQGSPHTDARTLFARMVFHRITHVAVKGGGSAWGTVHHFLHVGGHSDKRARAGWGSARALHW